MNYRNPQLIDELAAHYALGTLRGAARVRFERLCRQSLPALNAVHRWEDRLLGLAREIEPVTPSPTVWKAVQRRLGHGRIEQPSGWFSWLNKAQLAFAASVATLALGFAIWTVMNTSAPATVATFTDQQSEQWRIEAQADHEKLVVTRLASLALDASRDYELWALPDSGGAPVSLGLMPKSGKRDLELNLNQRNALAGASKIAISLEPQGGSRTGAPTGPVLFVTNVIRVG